MTGLPAAWARRQMWRLALTVTGGLRVEGRMPAEGGCVVVANHSSHADAAALLAALPARRRPLVVCAADYWKDSSWLRRWVSRALVDTVAVRRGGGGFADLEPVHAALQSGRAVVMFPEGTRSRDGSLGSFHSGAFRIAESAAVPVVPVGLHGTHRLLPANGDLRPTPVTVRIGRSLHRPDADQARVTVGDLSRPDWRRGESSIRARIARFAGSRRSVVAVAAWAVAESFSWPIVPEVLVGVLVLASPRHVVRLASTAVAGTAVGCLLAVSAAGLGLHAPQPLVTSHMRAVVAQDMARDGIRSVVHQPLSGIPVKVYAAQAGADHLSPWAFAAEAGAARGVRIVIVAGALALLAAAGNRLRRFYPFVIATALAAFTAGLSATVASWS